MEAVPNHPYIPTDLHLPDFVPNFLSVATILGIFGVASVLGIFLVWIISGRVPKIAKIDRVLMCWWAFSGLTHMILEGYFAFTPEFYKDKTPFFLSEVWKEYSKGDSRYAGRDPAIVSVEGITAAIAGPACLLAVYAIGKKTSYSHVLQIAIATGQLYGTAIYFITSVLQGDDFATTPLYYWTYYVLMNSFWVWIPALIVMRSWKKICRAVQVEAQVQKRSKTR